jgi:hypothetical protein
VKPLAKRALIGCGGLAAVAITSVVLIGIWLFKGPESGVKLGNEMDQYALDYI